jgi:hypothetical protein
MPLSRLRLRQRIAVARAQHGDRTRPPAAGLGASSSNIPATLRGSSPGWRISCHGAPPCPLETQASPGPGQGFKISRVFGARSNRNRCVTYLFTSLVALLASCANADPSISEAITRQFETSPQGKIDLALVGPDSWTRVCVLGPYTTAESAEETLGFKWDVKRFSRIGSDDSINLLVFVRENEVTAFTEHPRAKGDFLKLSPRCLQRRSAKLVRNIEDGEPHQLVANVDPE